MQCLPQTVHLLIICMFVEVAPEQQGQGHHCRPGVHSFVLCFSSDLSHFDSGPTYSFWSCVHPSTLYWFFFESAFLKAQADVYNKEAYETFLPP